MTPICFLLNIDQHVKIQLSAKFIEIIGSGFRATFNFQKFKVALKLPQTRALAALCPSELKWFAKERPGALLVMLRRCSPKRSRCWWQGSDNIDPVWLLYVDHSFVKKGIVQWNNRQVEGNTSIWGLKHLLFLPLLIGSVYHVTGTTKVKICRTLMLSLIDVLANSQMCVRWIFVCVFEQGLRKILIWIHATC